MSRQTHEGKCEHCSAVFDFYLIHNGFNDSAYAYCDRCGRTTVLSGWKVPLGRSISVYEKISPASEPFLDACPCGGRFRAAAVPRCPTCTKPLSPEQAAEWIESTAAGFAKGWRWQGSWDGVYAIVIANRLVDDNWIDENRAV